MKKFILSTFLILFSISFYAQVGMVFNDTLFPFGLKQTDFYHILEHDSFYFVEGYKEASPDPNYKFFIKFDKSGNIIKKKSFDPNFINFGGRWFNTVILTNNAIVNASYIRDSMYMNYGFIMALDFNLDTIWTRKYHYSCFSTTPVNNQFDDIKQTVDGGFLLSGHYSDTAYGSDRYPYLMQIDSIGKVRWVRKFNYKNSMFYRIELTPDYGVLIQTNINGACLLKTNSKGDILWEKKLPPIYIYMEGGNMVFAENNNYIIACPYTYYYQYPTSDEALYLCKINCTTGQIIWDTTYTPFISLECYPKMKVHMMTNGNFKVSATARGYDPHTNNIYFRMGVILYFNSNGDSLQMQSFKFSNESSDWHVLNDLIITNSGEYVGVGSFATNFVPHWWYAFPAWFFKTMPNTMGVQKPIIENIEYNIYPNPTKDYCYIESPSNNISEIEIFDIQGRLVKQINSAKVNDKLIKINIEGLEAGIYILKIKAGDKIYGDKIIIQ